jgi:hypothetical protein
VKAISHPKITKPNKIAGLFHGLEVFFIVACAVLHMDQAGQRLTTMLAGVTVPPAPTVKGFAPGVG